MSYSSNIRRYRGGIFNNPYQGKDKKVVFVCSMGILRSATAARIYSVKYNTRSCGSWPDALVPISDDLIHWAEELVFVNKENYEQVVKHYAGESGTLELIKEKSKVLNIPDTYEHMHYKLIDAFQEQYEQLHGYQLYVFSGRED